VSRAWFVALAVALGACAKKPPSANERAGDASSALVAADAGLGAAEDAGEENVEPVYPIEPNAPAVPLAEKLCDGLTSLPERKRAACCNTTPGIVLTSECTRTLSAAMRHGALSLSAAAVDACLTAYDQTLAGCDWVGPFPPGPPPECLGIFEGKLAQGAKCRSSLECRGDLRCVGLGPTTPGTCAPAGSGGETCGGTVDPLAGFTRQTDVDARHPECKERCIKHRCAPPAAEGAACQISSDCQDGLQCLPAPGGAPKLGVPAKRCVAGRAPSKEGEACPGGLCEGGLQCIRGRCAQRLAGGEACTADFECKGGCLRAAGAPKGTCGPRCDIR